MAVRMRLTRVGSKKNPIYRIVVADSGPANGAVIVVFERQVNTFELEDAPGATYDAAFQQVLDSFSFPAS